MLFFEVKYPGHFTGSGVRFAHKSLFIPVVAMLRATLRFGSLEAEKASSCSKPFTALMQ